MILVKGCSVVCFQLSSKVTHVLCNIKFHAIISIVSFQGACVGEYSRINVAMLSTTASITVQIITQMVRSCLGSVRRG